MIKPLNGRAVVRVEEAKEQTVSGIVLPSAAKEKQQVGVVEAVAENTEDFTSQLKEGDRVLFEKYAGSNGGTCKMIKPLNGRAVVRVEEAKEQTVSGIVLPSAAKEKQQVGVVEAVAENTEDFTSQLKEGDRVLFEKYAGSNGGTCK